MSQADDAVFRLKSFFLVQVPISGTSAFSDDNSLPEFARPAQNPFSAFDPANMQRRSDLLKEALSVFQAAESPAAGVEAAMGVFEDAARNGELALAQHVLGVFSVHAGKLRTGTPSLPVPPLAFRAEKEQGAVPFDDSGEDEEGEPGVVVPSEHLLHWFREDLYLNEHHRHWHFVYDTRGFPGPTGIRLKSRQGEVFVYMHQQMLARYDTERVAVGLEPVRPLTDYAESLGAGYDPDAREPKFLGYGARSDDALIGTNQRTDLEARRDAYRTYLALGGQIAGQTVPISAASVGTALESSLAFGTTHITTQAQADWIIEATAALHLHNVGHDVIARLGDGTGVMANPHTSLQDPVFWRWHRMIDDLAQEYYTTLPAHDLSGTGIVVDGAKIVIASQVETPDVDFAETNRDDLHQSIGDFTAAQLAAGTQGAGALRTGLITEDFVFLAPVQNREFSRTSLFCERFSVSVPVISDVSQSATARLFLCADIFLDLEVDSPDARRRAKRGQEHRFWIELDRKPVPLSAGQNLVTFVADESSVVRKLDGIAPWPTSSFTEDGFDELHQDALGSNDDYCDCGWPLNLAVPRGREGGMGFHMLIYVSPGSPNDAGNSCGSRAFCGARFDSYPELATLNLGYPFDRPAPNGTLALIRATDGMGVRRVSIEHLPGLAATLGLPSS